MVINQPFSFRSLPPAVRGLVLANGLVFLAQCFAGPQLVPVLGLVPARVLGDFWLWQPVTYMFLHGGFFHLLFNMYVLWAFGRELEFRWGPAAFLRYYFLCGIGAALLETALTPHSRLPSIGASGAIYGLLVAFAVLFPEAVLYLYLLIPMRAWQAVLLFAGIEFLAGFSGAASGVANFAHLGGMATGFLLLKTGSRLSFSHWRDRIGQWREGKKREKQSARLHDLDQEVDRILDKVLKKGVNSLTREEQDLMGKYSKSKIKR